ncbi:MAG TPA: hypothetical protein DCE41_30020 [Cytophagales bacterium]|nr:hypothetical protein [Cytophagales bacterium]
MVFINGEHITSLTDFSAKFNQVAGLIPDASEWLTWAVSVDTTATYHAVNEEDFLLQICEGLHEQSTVQLNQLRLDVRKLFSLREPEITLLLQHDETNPPDVNTMTAFLEGLNLLSYADAADGVAVISQQAIEFPKLFQAIRYEDQLLLYTWKAALGLDAGGSLTATQKEAISFAGQHADSVREFINLFHFYTDSVSQQLTQATTGTQRKKGVAKIYQLLEPLCNYLIYSPNIGTFSNNETLRAQLQQKVAPFNFIGYRTKSAALSNLTRNLQDLSTQEEPELKVAIEAYLTGVKEHILNTPTPACTLSQLEGLRTFRIQSNDFITAVEVNQNGDVALAPDTGNLTTS